MGEHLELTQEPDQQRLPGTINEDGSEQPGQIVTTVGSQLVHHGFRTEQLPGRPDIRIPAVGTLMIYDGSIVGRQASSGSGLEGTKNNQSLGAPAAEQAVSTQAVVPPTSPTERR